MPPDPGLERVDGPQLLVLAAITTSPYHCRCSCWRCLETCFHSTLASCPLAWCACLRSCLSAMLSLKRCCGLPCSVKRRSGHVSASLPHPPVLVGRQDGFSPPCVLHPSPSRSVNVSLASMPRTVRAPHEPRMFSACAIVARCGT